MNKLLIVSAISLVSMFANANSPYSYKCITDTKKDIQLEYVYGNSSYTVTLLMIGGEDHTRNAQIAVYRGSGTVVTVSNFRSGESLQLNLGGPEGPSYKLGTQGGVRPMECQNTTKRNDSVRNDGI